MHTEEHTQRDTHTGTPQNRHTHHNYSKKKKRLRTWGEGGQGELQGGVWEELEGEKGRGSFVILFKLKTYF